MYSDSAPATSPIDTPWMSDNTLAYVVVSSGLYLRDTNSVSLGSTLDLI